MAIDEMELERQGRQNPDIERLLTVFSESIDTSLWQNVAVNKGGYLEATIPMSQIAEHDFPINPAHSSSLATQFRQEAEITGGSGQTIPIYLATVIGEKGLHILDGFHRHDGMLQNGEDSIHAVLRANITHEQLIDERIAATRRQEVEVARTVDLAQQAWDLTPWKDKLDVKSAFHMVANKGKGKIHKLTIDEHALISAWMADKSVRWNLSPKQVLDHLKATETLDPFVVSYIRSQGDNGELGFTAKTAEKIVEMFTDIFSGETIYDFDLVALIAQTANRFNLSLDQTLALGRRVYDLNDYDASVSLCASYVPRDEVKPAPKNGNVKKSGPKYNYQPKASALPNATIEELLAQAHPQKVVDILAHAALILRKQIARGEIVVDSSVISRLSSVGSALLELAGKQPEDKWGIHKGTYNGTQVRETIANILGFIRTGEGPRPALPSILDQSARAIVLGVKQGLPETPDTETDTRIRDYVQELKLRFG